MLRPSLAAVLVVPLFALGGCGSGQESSTEISPTPATSSPAQATTESGVSVSGAPGTQPTITLETAATPPEQLVVKQITPGTGKAVGPNSLVTVQYTGVAWSSGQVFDSSWATGEVQFPIKGVISGWQQGLQGVKEGARVLLIIPPDQAYGSTPPPGSGIAVDDTLVFVVDVEKVGS